jgi:hypothetical protein
MKSTQARKRDFIGRLFRAAAAQLIGRDTAALIGAISHYSDWSRTLPLLTGRAYSFFPSPFSFVSILLLVNVLHSAIKSVTTRLEAILCR